MTFLPHQLIGGELLPAERAGRQRISSPVELCKARYVVRRRQGVSVLGLLRTDFCKKQLFMDGKNIAKMTSFCSFPSKRCIIKNLADVKTFRPPQGGIAHYLLQLLL